MRQPLRPPSKKCTAVNRFDTSFRTALILHQFPSSRKTGQAERLTGDFCEPGELEHRGPGLLVEPEGTSPPLVPLVLCVRGYAAMLLVRMRLLGGLCLLFFGFLGLR